MKIRVTKTFANFLNKMAKNGELHIDHAEVVEMSERGYVLNLGTIAMMDAEFYGDYDYGTDKYKAIVVVYPDEFYACNRYLSTKELSDEFRRLNVMNENELKEMMRGMLEI